MVWTEGTGWNRGGKLAWEVYDKDGRPIDGAGGRDGEIPVWSFATAWVNNTGGFFIGY